MWLKICIKFDMLQFSTLYGNYTLCNKFVKLLLLWNIFLVRDRVGRYQTGRVFLA